MRGRKPALPNTGSSGLLFWPVCSKFRSIAVPHAATKCGSSLSSPTPRQFIDIWKARGSRQQHHRLRRPDRLHRLSLTTDQSSLSQTDFSPVNGFVRPYGQKVRPNETFVARQETHGRFVLYLIPLGICCVMLLFSSQLKSWRHENRWALDSLSAEVVYLSYGHSPFGQMSQHKKRGVFVAL
jgi:hypothetical protein